MTYTRTFALLALSDLLLLQIAIGADFNGGGLVTGPRGRIMMHSSLTRRQTEYECPSGWAFCSETTRYPLDGSQCCADASLPSASSYL